MSRYDSQLYTLRPRSVALKKYDIVSIISHYPYNESNNYIYFIGKLWRLNDINVKNSLIVWLLAYMIITVGVFFF